MKYLTIFAVVCLLLSVSLTISVDLHQGKSGDNHENDQQPLADLTKSINISNLNADNWVLGNLTMEQYESNRFNIIKANSVIQCPVQRPYVLKGTTTCQQCPSSASTFDLQSDICVNKATFSSTPQSSVSSPQLLTDVSNNINITNLNGNNWILGNMSLNDYYQARYNIISQANVTQCSLETPYVINDGSGDCKQCPEATPIFVLQNHTCVNCQNGQQWDSTSETCVPKPNNSIILIADVSSYTNITNLDGKNWILGNTTLEDYYTVRYNTISTSNVTRCPIETPYVIAGNSSCQQCAGIFVVQNSTCILCNQDQVWNATTVSCQNSTNINKAPSNTTNSPNVTSNQTNSTTPNANISKTITPNTTTPNVTTPNTTTPNATTPNSTLPNSTTPLNNITNSNASVPNTSISNGSTPKVGAITPPSSNTSNVTQNVTTPNITIPNNNQTVSNASTPNASAPNVTPPPKVGVVTPPVVNNTSNPNITSPNITAPINNQNTSTNATIPSVSNITTPNVTIPNANTTTTNATKVTAPINNTLPLSNASSATPNITNNKTSSNVTTPTSNVTTPTVNPSTTIPLIETCSDVSSCPIGKFFNPVTSACASCQLGQYFDESWQACLFCPDSTPLLNSINACVVCPSGKAIDRPTNTCI